MSFMSQKKLRTKDIRFTDLCLVLKEMSFHSITSVTKDYEITEWFHEQDADGWSPYMCVEYVVNTFCKDIERKGYLIDIQHHLVLYDMCTATCVMYENEFKPRRYLVGAPKRKFSRPRQWSSALEHQWNDYLHSRIVDHDYWKTFWRLLPVGFWEQFITKDSWRELMQYLLPFYIHREVDILVEQEIVCQETDGNIITWEEYESEEEPNVRDADKSKKKKP
jgi:hypothetical protein